MSDAVFGKIVLILNVFERKNLLATIQPLIFFSRSSLWNILWVMTKSQNGSGSELPILKHGTEPIRN
jgi:hypothetical protein